MPGEGLHPSRADGGSAAWQGPRPCAPPSAQPNRGGHPQSPRIPGSGRPGLALRGRPAHGYTSSAFRARGPPQRPRRQERSMKHPKKKAAKKATEARSDSAPPERIYRPFEKLAKAEKLARKQK